MNLRLRICSVLAVFVAVNALFVLVLLWAYGVFIPWLVAGILVFLPNGTVDTNLLRLPVSWATALVLIAGFLAAQAYYGYRRVLSGTESGDADNEIIHIVHRLAMTADVPEPTVRVVAADDPSCYTVGRITDATIVVTTGLVERLDGDELEAVLAHEVAHVANRDVTLMTITTLFLDVADRAYHAARLARRALSPRHEVSARGKLALQWFLPLVALTYVFVAPLLWVFPMIADWATRTLSHAREFAADGAAARITGKPLALATALLTLAETTAAPATDLRTAKTRALCVAPLEPVSGDEATSVPPVADATDADRRRERVTAWLEGKTPSQPSTATATDAGTDTHPPLEDRLERLQELAVELEREGSG